ncbi:MAG: hypothetical protein QXU98_03820 [Candidatus Parvarchaeota archaeon]
MSTFYTFLNDKFNLSTMKEDIINTILNNIKVQVSKPQNPNAIQAATPANAGLGVTYTPSTTGRILIIVTGQVGNTNANEGANIQLAYGTGTSPTNGSQATGTVLGNSYAVMSGINNQYFPFTFTYVLTGLTIGTRYWFDLQANVIGSGNVMIQSVTVLIVEF